MRYISFWEIKDLNAIGKRSRAKYDKLQEARKKNPDMFPTPLLLQDGSPATGRLSLSKGVVLYEATEQQMINVASYVLPDVEITFSPLLDREKVDKAWEALGML